MPLKHTVEEIVLKNGARGLLIDVPDATVVAYDIQFRAGYQYAPSAELQQTPHIMEHMAFKGVEGYPTPEVLSQELSKNGATRNAFTSQYSMRYIIDCAHMEWDRVLDFQKLVITKPAYQSETLEAEKGNVTEELTGNANNNQRVLSMHIDRALGDDAFLDEEKLKTVAAVNLEHIEAFHKKTHTLRNLRFSFAGDLGSQKDRIIAMLEAWELPSGEVFSVPKKTYASAAPVSLERKDMKSLNWMLKVVLHREITEQEQTALLAINHILSGTMHSRIFGRARKQGLAYGLGFGFDVSPDNTTTWSAGGQVRKENAKPLAELIVKELHAISHGAITQEELDEAKQYGLGAYQMLGQTVRSVNDWYSGEYFGNGTVIPMQDRQKYLEALDVPMLEKVVNEFLQNGAWGFGVIGNISQPETDELHAVLATVFNEV